MRMELYLYLLSLDSLPEDGDSLREKIDALPFGNTERDRLRRISHPLTLRQSLGGKLALWRLAEKRRLPHPLTILRTESGKPYFENPALPDFSISHSDALALAVLSDQAGVPVGADLQFVTENRNTMRIAARCLTQREMAECAESEDPRQVFFRLWAQKEAVAKQSGMGLSAIFAKEAQDSALSLKTFLLHHGEQTAYVSVAAPEEITHIHMIHSIKELSYEQL